MKKILFIVAMICCSVQLSCKKENTVSTTSNQFKGTWRMVMVKEISSGNIVNNPAEASGQVEITFTATTDSTGTFSGKTANNTINGADYKTSANHTIEIPFLIITKVAETPWGDLFVKKILFATQYDFGSNGLLNITAANAILSFKKL
jgi:hypothetical protein